MICCDMYLNVSNFTLIHESCHPCGAKNCLLNNCNTGRCPTGNNRLETQVDENILLDRLMVSKRCPIINSALKGDDRFVYSHKGLRCELLVTFKFQ